jgi:hypothetical protein
VSKGRLLAALIGALTVVFVVIGTLWPVPAAVAYAGGKSLLRSSSSAQGAVETLADEIRSQAWADAYSSLGNKAEFSQQAFVHDLTGYYSSLRTYATLLNFDVLPQHSSDQEATILLRMHWSTVVGTFVSARTLRVVKAGDRWKVDWPLEKEQPVPPKEW